MEILKGNCPSDTEFTGLLLWVYGTKNSPCTDSSPCDRGRVFPRVKTRGVFRPRQTRQLPRAVDLKGRLLSCQSY